MATIGITENYFCGDIGSSTDKMQFVSQLALTQLNKTAKMFPSLIISVFSDIKNQHSVAKILAFASLVSESVRLIDRLKNSEGIHTVGIKTVYMPSRPTDLTTLNHVFIVSKPIFVEMNTCTICTPHFYAICTVCSTKMKHCWTECHLNRRCHLVLGWLLRDFVDKPSQREVVIWQQK